MQASETINELAPNQTVYLSDLNEKVKIDGTNFKMRINLMYINTVNYFIQNK